MSIENFKTILDRIKSHYKSKLPLISFAAYNEPTLDPHFKERLRLMTQMGFTYWWLSNGSLMTKDLVDFLIKEKPNTTDYFLNLCSSDPAVLSKSVNISEESAGRTLTLLAEALPKLQDTGKKAHIKVHGDGSSEHKVRIERMKEWAEPLGAIVIETGVMDRAGMLEGVGRSIEHPKNAWLVCGASYLSNLYIGADGGAYLCCHDYYQKTTYGNITEQGIVALKKRGERKAALSILKDTFCSRCEFAIDVKQNPVAALELTTRNLRRKLPSSLRSRVIKGRQTLREVFKCA